VLEIHQTIKGYEVFKERKADNRRNESLFMCLSCKILLSYDSRFFNSCILLLFMFLYVSLLDQSLFLEDLLQVFESVFNWYFFFLSYWFRARWLLLGLWWHLLPNFSHRFDDLLLLRRNSLLFFTLLGLSHLLFLLCLCLLRCLCFLYFRVLLRWLYRLLGVGRFLGLSWLLWRLFLLGWGRLGLPISSIALGQSIFGKQSQYQA
jgi:hypothetical protein